MSRIATANYRNSSYYWRGFYRYTELMRTTKQAAIGFIFVTLLIDVMGWGLIIPVMADLIAELKGIPMNLASSYGAFLLSAFAVTQFVFSPLVGNLSDRFGRRPILLISLLGFAVDYLILAWAPTYGWLFAGQIGRASCRERV